MTSEVVEKASPRKSPVTYSKELVDRIADKLADNYSLRQISTAYPEWSPNYSTLRKWQYEDSYARQKWIEARLIDLPIKLRERLQELKSIDLDAIAIHCQDLVSEGRITQSMADKLFEAKKTHLYKEMDLILRELEVEDPKKWGKKLQIDATVEEKAKGLSKPELEEKLKSLGYVLVPQEKIIEGEK